MKLFLIYEVVEIRNIELAKFASDLKSYFANWYQTVVFINRLRDIQT